MNLDREIAVRNSKTIYRDGDRCVKVFDETYSNADVLNEALNQARAGEEGINTPMILEVTNENGRWAIISEFIKGKTLEQLMKENPDKTEEYLKLFVDLHVEILSHSGRLLKTQKDELDRKIFDSDLDATTRFDLFSKLAEEHGKYMICHGDFIPSNIIISEEGKAYILDWSHATKGSPCGDVARTYLLLSVNNKDIADRYLDLFCEKRGESKEEVMKWVPIVAASQSVNCNKEDRAFMLSRVLEAACN